MAMIVPQYERRQVTEAARPVGVQAAQSGLAEVAKGISDVGSTFQQWQADVDEADAKAADTAYSNDVRAALYDPENGYLNTSGGSALSRRKEVLGNLEKAYNDRLNTLSPNARAMAESAFQGRLDSARQGVDVHAGRERITYLDTQSDARIQAAVNDAVTDPRAMDRTLSILRNEVAEKSSRAGWSPEQTKAAMASSESELYRMTTINMAEADPVAAAEFLAQRAATMAPADLMVARDALAKPLAAIAEQEAIANVRAGVGPEKLGETTFAASDLPQEAYALLGTIAGTEAPDYQTINGGEKFDDLSDHPRRKGAGGTSTAAGRYQFVQATWDRAAGANGFGDFSPENQDRGAWWLAQQDYKANTGRDLMGDLQAGKYSEIRAGLSSTWEGIHKLSDAEFAKRMESAGGVVLSPRVSAAIDALPAHQAEQVRQASLNGISAWRTEQQAAASAEQTKVKESFQLRIATGDVRLTDGEILGSPLDDGDKATLIKSRATKFKDIEQTQADVTAFTAGQMVVDPYSTEGRKRVDGLWKEQSKTIQQGEDPAALVEGIVSQTGLVPSAVNGALRQGITSRDPAMVQSALVTAGRIAAIDPHALGRRDGGTQVAEMATLYDHLTGTVGLSSEQAVQRVMDLSEPEKMADRRALLASPATETWLKGKATVEDARSVFSEGFFSRTPKLGETPIQEAAAVSEYREILEQSLIDTNGDQDLAATLASDRFKRRYGTSEYSMTGANVVTRLPPEVTYPAGPDGGHSYIGAQAIAALAKDDLKASDVFLQSDGTTAADVRAGRPPRYVVYYTDEDGMIQQHQFRFSAEPPTPSEVTAARKAQAMEEQRQLIERNRALRAPENQRGNNALR